MYIDNELYGNQVHSRFQMLDKGRCDMALLATQVVKFKMPEKELWVSDGDKLFLVITPNRII